LQDLKFYEHPRLVMTMVGKHPFDIMTTDYHTFLLSDTIVSALDVKERQIQAHNDRVTRNSKDIIHPVAPYRQKNKKNKCLVT
jgi:hypothetical protein